MRTIVCSLRRYAPLQKKIAVLELDADAVSNALERDVQLSQSNTTVFTFLSEPASMRNASGEEIQTVVERHGRWVRPRPRRSRRRRAVDLFIPRSSRLACKHPESAGGP